MLVISPDARREFAEYDHTGTVPDREDDKCHPSGPATIAPQVCARARTQPPMSTSSRPPPRVYGVGNAGNDGSRCGCACPAAGSHARTAPRTSTPEPTTRRPTTPSPSAIRAAHTHGGVMSTTAQSELGRCADRGQGSAASSGRSAEADGYGTRDPRCRRTIATAVLATPSRTTSAASTSSIGAQPGRFG